MSGRGREYDSIADVIKLRNNIGRIYSNRCSPFQTWIAIGRRNPPSGSTQIDQRNWYIFVVET